MSCRRYLIHGLVQGVMFRAGAQATAQRLALTGWVRNLADGRVELIACGDAARLDELERWLWQGPPNAQVAGVESCEAPAQELRGFRITD